MIAINSDQRCREIVFACLKCKVTAFWGKYDLNVVVMQVGMHGAVFHSGFQWQDLGFRERGHSFR